MTILSLASDIPHSLSPRRASAGRLLRHLRLRAAVSASFVCCSAQSSSLPWVQEISAGVSQGFTFSAVSWNMPGLCVLEILTTTV